MRFLPLALLTVPVWGYVASISTNAEVAILVEAEQNVESLEKHLITLADTLTRIGEAYDSQNLTLSLSYHQTSNILQEDCFHSLTASSDQGYLPLPWVEVVPLINGTRLTKGAPSDPATTRAIPFLAFNGFSTHRFNTRRLMLVIVTSNATWAENEDPGLFLGDGIACQSSSMPTPAQVFQSLKQQQVGLLIHKIGTGFSDPDEWARFSLDNNFKDFVEVTSPEDTDTGVPVPLEEDPLRTNEIQDVALNAADFVSEDSAVQTSVLTLLSQTVEVAPRPAATLQLPTACELEYGVYEHIVIIDTTSKRADRLMSMAGRLSAHLETMVEGIEALGGDSRAAVYLLGERGDEQRWCFGRPRSLAQSTLGLQDFLQQGLLDQEAYEARGLGNAVVIEALHWTSRTFTNSQTPQHRFVALFTSSAPVLGLERYSYVGLGFPCSGEQAYSLDAAMVSFRTEDVRLMVYIADDNDDAQALEESAEFWQGVFSSRLRSQQGAVIIGNIEDPNEDALQIGSAARMLLCEQ